MSANSPVLRLKQDMDARGTRSSKVTGLDLRAVRDFNRRLVLNCVRDYGPIPRTDIADRIGLSRPTVSSIIDMLLKDGLVHEGSPLGSAEKGGRPANGIYFKADAGYTIGIDIGRTHLNILLTDLSAGTPSVIKRHWDSKFDARRGGKDGIDYLADRLCEIVKDSSVEWKNVVGIGIGIPGTLDLQLRMLNSPPEMPGWSGIDIPKDLERQLKVRLKSRGLKFNIFVDNDANMGALGESRYGAGRGTEDMIYVKISTGIGAGLILNGHLFRGGRGTAGELGHMTIDENGPPCASNCKNRGCLETFAAAHAIVQDACEGISLHSRLKDTQAALTGSLALAGSPHVTIGRVIEEAKNGDAACCTALERAGERVGVGLANLIALYSPLLILLGGSVVRAGDLFLTPLHRTVRSRSLCAPWEGEGIKIELGKLGRNAIAFGAVATVTDKAFPSSSRYIYI